MYVFKRSFKKEKKIKENIHPRCAKYKVGSFVFAEVSSITWPQSNQRDEKTIFNKTFFDMQNANHWKYLKSRKILKKLTFIFKIRNNLKTGLIHFHLVHKVYARGRTLLWMTWSFYLTSEDKLSLKNKSQWRQLNEFTFPQHLQVALEDFLILILDVNFIEPEPLSWRNPLALVSIV